MHFGTFIARTTDLLWIFSFIFLRVVSWESSARLDLCVNIGNHAKAEFLVGRIVKNCKNCDFLAYSKKPDLHYICFLSKLFTVPFSGGEVFLKIWDSYTSRLNFVGYVTNTEENCCLICKYYYCQWATSQANLVAYQVLNTV